jgi:hypothetical protein
MNYERVEGKICSRDLEVAIKPKGKTAVAATFMLRKILKEKG